MKIALAQMDVMAGDPKKNFATIERFVAEAHEKKVDIIAFPEMCVAGYLVGDLWLEDEECRHFMSFNEKIRKLSAIYDIGIIYGNIYMADDIKPWPVDKDRNFRFCNFDGRAIRFNAAYAFQSGRVVKRRTASRYLPDGIQPKTLLPNYRYFDDERYFMSMSDFVSIFGHSSHEINSPFIFEFDGREVFIGVELCEDAWWIDYNLNPSYALKCWDSEVIINISASPWTCGKNDARDRRIASLLKWDETCPPFAYVNCVGAQNNGNNILVFDGASTVYGKDGKPKILGNADYKEELIIFDHDKIPVRTRRRKKEEDIPRKYQAIIRGVRHMSEVSGIWKYVIGLSGGIDSAVVASILVDAVGKENVFAINMPTQYNSDATKNAARSIASKLGISYRVVPIEKLVSGKMDLVKIGSQRYNLKELTEENIQAKIRGTLLSDIAGEMGALFTCNGNKNEVFIGYATLYGDWGGAIAPIFDLTKTNVYRMAEHINTIHENHPIDKDVVNRVIEPSAELKNEQKDPILIGYHCAIIKQVMDYQKHTISTIMRWWLDGVLDKKLGIDQDFIKKLGMDNGEKFVADLRELFYRRRATAFKRQQMPPGIVLTKTAFGEDYREAILPKIQWTDEVEDLAIQIIKN